MTHPAITMGYPAIIKLYPDIMLLNPGNVVPHHDVSVIDTDNIMS